MQYSRPLPGPSLDDVLVRVLLPAAGPSGKDAVLLIGVNLDGCRSPELAAAVAQLRTAVSAETRSVNEVARALAAVRAAAVAAT